MLFYGIYVGKVVGKATRECGCCMAKVGIRCYVIFREKKYRYILVTFALGCNDLVILSISCIYFSGSTAMYNLHCSNIDGTDEV